MIRLLTRRQMIEKLGSQKDKGMSKAKDEYNEFVKNEMDNEDNVICIYVKELEAEKAELIIALKTVNEKIEEFELYNELSIDLLYAEIENLLIKHRARK